MLNVILDLPPLEVNPQTEQEAIEESRRDAQALVAWLSVPGVALRYNLDAEFLLYMFTVLLHSSTPWESAGDINELVEYVRNAVGAGC